jgi:hypothetical protein
LLSTYLSIGTEHRRVNPHGRVTSTVRCGGWYACGTYRHRLSIVAPSGPTRARCDIPRSWGCARTRRQRMSFWRRKRIEKASPCTQFRPALSQVGAGPNCSVEVCTIRGLSIWSNVRSQMQIIRLSRLPVRSMPAGWSRRSFSPSSG